jgi:ubiquinone/menaquinone biosynthesis C-methylase UbiE
MKTLNNDYFDYILFSFNGLDYISHDDRIEALKEIKRVGKNGSIYVFSAHNIQSISQLYSVKFTINPVKLLLRIKRFFKLIFLNGFPKKFYNKKFSILNDGVHKFKLNTYYITPIEQIKQLKELGFMNIRLYSSETGNEIKELNLNLIKDNWIYYFCEIKKIDS